jgi:hypothetical protein
MFCHISKNSSKVYLSSIAISRDKSEFVYTYKLRIYGDEYVRKIKNILRSNISNSTIVDNLKCKGPSNLIDFEQCYWINMPEYDYPDVAESIIDFVFRQEDMVVVDRIMTSIPHKKSSSHGKTVSFNIPKKCGIVSCYKGQMIITDEPVLPQYPIYVISLGRYEDKLRATSKWLDLCKIPYYLVCEPHEETQYRSALSSANVGTVLVLPESFSKTIKRGGIPARNWVFQHSKNNGDEAHWILDDNIEGYTRRNKYQRIPVYSGVVFKSIEDYVNRYTNIKMAGHHYTSMTPAIYMCNPIRFNTRIYSSILIKNDIDTSIIVRDANTEKGFSVVPDTELWKGTYNEDTDLSIRQLLLGHPTALFLHFTANKMTTGQLKKGGNFDSIYENGRDEAFLKKVQEIKDRYDGLGGCSIKIVSKFSKKYHHEIVYPNHDNELESIDEEISNIPNEYGMRYVDNVYKIAKFDDDVDVADVDDENIMNDTDEVDNPVPDIVENRNDVMPSSNLEELSRLNNEELELLSKLEHIKKRLEQIRIERNNIITKITKEH